MEIYLIRHTAVKIGENTCYGQLNVPLNELTFAKSLESIKNKLPKKIDLIYSSPLERCKILAEKIGLTTATTNLIFDNNLLEMNFGEWEGKKWNEINQEHLTQWMNNFVEEKPPGGENLLQVYARVENFINLLRTSPEINNKNQLVIVAHAGVMRCFYAYWLRIPLENLFKISINYAEVHHFKLSNKKETDLIYGRIK